MSIRLKAFCIILSVFLLFGASGYFVKKNILIPSFLELEKEQVRKDMERISLSVKKEIDHVDLLCHDWSAWDEAYNFLKTGSKKFIEINLPVSTFTNNRLNLLYYINLSGKIIWGAVYDLETNEYKSINDFPQGAISLNHPLIHPHLTFSGDYGEIKAIKGILATEAGPLLISSRPVLTGANQGPATGILVMGRFLNEKMIRDINNSTQVDFSIKMISDKLGNFSSQPAFFPDDIPFTVDESSKTYLSIESIYPDIVGRPVLTVTAQIPRSIVSRGEDAVRSLLWYFLASMSLAFIALVIMIQKRVVRPISVLTAHAESITKNRDMSLRTGIKGNDEIGRLASVFDGMLNQLEHFMIQLKKSEEKHRLMTEYSPAHIFIFQDEALVYANPSVLKALGYSGEDVTGMSTSQIFHPDDLDMLHELNKFRKPETDRLHDQRELRYLTRGGETRFLELVTILTEHEGKPSTLGYGVDITERKIAQIEKAAIEERLRLSEKMETIGMLAGGVAHDLNNILSGIISYPDLLLSGISNDSPFKRPLETIKKSGMRAAAIVQDLLSLARRGVVVRETVSLNHVVSEYLLSPEFERLKSIYPEVSIELDIEEGLLPVKGSPSHLAAMLMNLVTNAAESIQSQGVISISTKNRIDSDKVEITVSDTGKGISKEDIGRIFEPFYTKKVMGRSGTGLGMSLVWGTVNDHGGTIDVKSRPGTGTVFTITLPASKDDFWQKSDLKAVPKGKGEKILIVDDISEQTEIASTMLSRLGYDTTSVGSGEAAVKLFSKTFFDLLIIDMIMDPGINGLETYSQISSIKKGQKALIVSGYSETELVSRALELGAGGLIKKPYLFDELGKAVHAELNK